MRKFIKSAIFAVAGLMCSLQANAAAEFYPSNIDQVKEGQYVITNLGMVPIVQMLKLDSDLVSDAYFELNGKTIPVLYDFRMNALVVKLSAEKHLTDGLQYATFAVKTENGPWQYKEQTFLFDGTLPLAEIENTPEAFYVTVKDPDGFDKIWVEGFGINSPGTIKLEPGTTSHSFAVSKNSLSSKIEVFARKEGITFDDVTKILQESAPNLVAVDSPQFLSIQKEGLTLRNDPRRDNLCTGTSCTTKDVGQCVGHLGSLRQLLETSEETPYELDAGEIAEIASEITRVSSRVKGGCTKEEKRALEDQIRRLKGIISKAKSSASRLQKEVLDAKKSAQQKIKESEKEIDKLKKERDEKDKKLKERSDELNNIRTRCWKFFSSLPGASLNPTGQHVGSDENLKNPFGGKVNITDGDKFAETLESSSVKRELKNCRKKIKEAAEKVEELNDEVNKKQAELNQAEANHANLVASLNANLASLEAKLSLAERAVQIFQNALDALAEAARRCGIEIEQARKAELEKRAREAQMERERTRERRKELEERERRKREEARQQQLERQRLESKRRAAQQAERDKKKREEEVKRIREKAKSERHPDPIEPDNKQLRFGGQKVLRELWMDSYVNKGPCHCITKALAAANNTNSIVQEIIGGLAVDVAFAPIGAFPGLGLGSRLAVGAAQGVGKYVYGGESLPQSVATNLFTALGGHIFNKLVSESIPTSAMETLAGNGLGAIFAEEGIRAVTWEGTTDTRNCGKVHAKSVLMFNPYTRWVAIVIRVDNCPLVVIKYKVNENGVPVNSPTAKIIR